MVLVNLHLLLKCNSVIIEPLTTLNTPASHVVVPPALLSSISDSLSSNISAYYLGLTPNYTVNLFSLSCSLECYGKSLSIIVVVAVKENLSVLGANNIFLNCLYIAALSLLPLFSFVVLPIEPLPSK